MKELFALVFGFSFYCLIALIDEGIATDETYFMAALSGLLSAFFAHLFIED